MRNIARPTAETGIHILEAYAEVRGTRWIITQLMVSKAP